MCACVAMVYSNPHGLIGVKTAKNEAKDDTRQAGDEDNFALPEQWQDGVSNSTEIERNHGTGIAEAGLECISLSSRVVEMEAIDILRSILK